MPITAALLGSGIFAKVAYLPALPESGINIRTIWSRSESSSSALLSAAKSQSPPLPGIESINAVYGEHGLATVLGDKDIDAVIIVLPIGAQPDMVRKALKAGKHVISEKPLHKDTKEAKELILEYEKEYKPKGLIWRVAENWAHEPTILKAAKILRDPKTGPVLYWNCKQESVVIDGKSYHTTQWRVIPDYQGGFLLDGGVHQAAMLRTILPIPPARVISAASLHRTHLLPHDTITALLLPPVGSEIAPLGPATTQDTGRPTSIVPTAIGNSFVTGTLMMSFAPPDVANPESRDKNGIWVVCQNATINLRTDGMTWSIVVTPAQGSEVQAVNETVPASGVTVELQHFGKAVGKAKSGEKDEEPNYGEPRGALWDVALIEACLTSNGKEIDLDSLLL